MARETERKFLLANEGWRGLAPGLPMRQGYLSLDPERVVRVRIAGPRAFLTVKGRPSGISCLEFEYSIPVPDAEAMLAALALGPLVEKVRHAIPFGGLVWEVDEFFGENRGLVLAEVELEHEGQSFDKPGWIGEEVTGDPRYYNASLITRPFARW